MDALGDIVLVSCYELGRQPTALAWPVAFLRRAGFLPVCLDLAVEPLDEAAEARLAGAKLVAISVPMHTALRLGVRVAERVKQLGPAIHVVCFGVYAPLHAPYLARHGVDSVLGAECEDALVALVEALAAGRALPEPHKLRRLSFPVPARDALPPAARYTRLLIAGPDQVAGQPPEQRLTGNVEATRGCKHMCRHCPLPAVYAGRFFAVPVDIVIADALAQIAAGARHLTFGDPDFLNAPTHALAVARRLAAAAPGVTWDATIKVEHVLASRAVFPELARLGCVFVVSAFESRSDRVLDILAKGHHAADEHEALAIVRAAGISLRPTFVAFTPWTTRADYLALCRFIVDEQLEAEVDPIQLALRLLVPPGSLLLGHAELTPHLGPLDEAALTYRWTHPDAAMDALQLEIARLVEDATAANEPADETFLRILAQAERVAGDAGVGFVPRPAGSRRQPPPRLAEPWFC
ncbi:MAG: CUAEP/CCAEP-tail radical SAM protein [Kofleriaceae bacterium]